MSAPVEVSAVTGAAAPVLVAGEALLDLVVDAGGTLAGHPGGGPFNTARTIGRLGRPVAFLGRLSSDSLGATHERMLADDGVDLRCVARTPEPTTLALASLDARGAASFTFYAAGTAAAGLEPDAALALLPDRVAALHVGSLGLVLEPLATAVEAVVERVAGAAAIVVVDPNCRPQAITDEDGYRARLERVLARCDLVKASEEDLAWLDPGRPPAEAARALLHRGPRTVLLTRGADGAIAITARGDTPIAARPTRVIDTIGAGDAFGGGFLAWWTSRGLGRDDLARDELVLAGAHFAAAVAARTLACAGASPPRLAARAGGEPLTVDSL